MGLRTAKRIRDPYSNAYRFSAVTGLLRFFCPMTLIFAGFLRETAYNLRK